MTTETYRFLDNCDPIQMGDEFSISGNTAIWNRVGPGWAGHPVSDLPSYPCYVRRPQGEQATMKKLLEHVQELEKKTSRPLDRYSTCCFPLVKNEGYYEEGYRFLAVGDVIQEGDEYWNRNEGPWATAACFTGSPLDASLVSMRRREEAPIKQAVGWSASRIAELEGQLRKEQEVNMGLHRTISNLSNELREAKGFGSMQSAALAGAQEKVEIQRQDIQNLRVALNVSEGQRLSLKTELKEMHAKYASSNFNLHHLDGERLLQSKEAMEHGDVYHHRYCPTWTAIPASWVGKTKCCVFNDDAWNYQVRRKFKGSYRVLGCEENVMPGDLYTNKHGGWQATSWSNERVQSLKMNPDVLANSAVYRRIF